MTLQYIIESTSYCYRKEAPRCPSRYGRSHSQDISCNITEQRNYTLSLQHACQLTRDDRDFIENHVQKERSRQWKRVRSACSGNITDRSYRRASTTTPSCCSESLGSCAFLARVGPHERISPAFLVVQVQRAVGFKPDCLTCHEAEFVCLVLRQLRDFLQTKTQCAKEGWNNKPREHPRRESIKGLFCRW